MKKIGMTVLVAVVGLAMLAPTGMAAEKKAKKAKKADKPAAEAPAVAQVTQAELAQMMVKILGLARFLPVAPSDQQCYAILLDNSISPAEGWAGDKVVTKADLARVIVQALKKQGEIENPDDPKEWIDYLKSLGVPMDSVGEAVSYLEPLPEPVATHVAAANVDPLVKRHRFNPVDEMQYGVDMEYVVRVFSQFEFINGEFRPLTPD
ncbi:MAG: hypothetical protein KA248_05575 [Kiritimatiellae bacterium]|nr:hypothetical protein [Kiritimatiellia bacterium]